MINKSEQATIGVKELNKLAEEYKSDPEMLKQIDDVNIASTTLNLSPFVIACKYGYLKVIQSMLEINSNLILSVWSLHDAPFFVNRNKEVLKALLPYAEKLVNVILTDADKLPNTAILTLIIETYIARLYLSKNYPQDTKFDDQDKYQTYLETIDSKLINNKIFFYTRYAEILSREGEFFESQKQFELAYNICKLKDNHPNAQIFLLTKIGLLLQARGKLDEAEKVLKEALIVIMKKEALLTGDAKRNVDASKGPIALALAQGLLYSNKYKFCMSYLKTAEESFKKENITHQLRQTLYNKAWLLYFCDELSLVIEAGNKFIELQKEPSSIGSCEINILLSVAYYVSGKIKSAENAYNKISKVYFQHLRKLVFPRYVEARDNSNLIIKFEMARERLIKIIQKEDYDHLGLKIAIIEYAKLFKLIVENFCLVERRDDAGKFWELYSDIIELALRQNDGDLDILDSSCIVSRRLLFKNTPPLVEAVVEHMFQASLFLTGRTIFYDFTKAYQIKEGGLNSKRNSSEKTLTVSHSTSEFTQHTTGCSEILPDQAKPHLVQCITLLKIFFLSPLFSINEGGIEYNRECEEDINIADCINIMTSIKNNILRESFIYETTVKVMVEEKEFFIVDDYLHASLFIFYRLSMNVLNRNNFSGNKSIIDKACFLFKNFFPLKSDFNIQWLDVFCLDKTLPALNNGDNLPRTILQAIINWFYTIITADAGSVDNQENESIYSTLNALVEAGYSKLKLVTLTNYINSFKKINVNITCDIDFNDLILIFSDKEMAKKFGRLLGTRKFFCEHDDKDTTIFKLEAYRSKKTFDKILESLEYLLRSESYKAPEIASLKPVPSIDYLPTVIHSDEYFDDAAILKNYEQKNKETKKDKKTKTIRLKLQEKKEHKKKHKEKNEKDKNKTQMKDDNKKELLTNTVDKTPISAEAQSEKQENIEFIVHNTNPAWTLSSIKSNSNLPTTLWDREQYNRWLTYDLDLLNTALNHANQLKDFLLKCKDFSIKKTTILHNILLHSIIIFNCISESSLNTKFAKRVTPPQANKFRNILLHQWNFFLNDAHNEKLLFSENGNALADLIVKQFQPMLEAFLSNKEFIYEDIDLEQHPIYKLFLVNRNLNIKKLKNIITNKSVGLVYSELDEISDLFISLAKKQDDLKNCYFSEIKMRLVKIGDLSKELKERNSYFCVTEFSSTLRLGHYSPGVYGRVNKNALNYDQFESDIKTKHSFPLLRQLYLLGNNKQKLLAILTISDFLMLCIEIRNIVVHTFSGLKFFKLTNYAAVAEWVNQLIFDLSSIIKVLNSSVHGRTLNDDVMKDEFQNDAASVNFNM